MAKQTKESPAVSEGLSGEPLGTKDAYLYLQLSPEAIALRAYFIAEKRLANGLPPDPVNDWLQAEHEILQSLAADIQPENAASESKNLRLLLSAFFSEHGADINRLEAAVPSMHPDIQAEWTRFKNSSFYPNHLASFLTARGTELRKRQERGL